MTSNDLNYLENQIVNNILKAPKPKINVIPKKISYINLIEADDDESDSEETNYTYKDLNIKKCKYSRNLSGNKH